MRTRAWRDPISVGSLSAQTAVSYSGAMDDEVGSEGEGPSRISRLNDWRRDVSAQIAGLPASVAELRRAIADLRRVVERLEVATETLEHANRIYESSGAMEAARVVTDATVRINEGAMELAKNSPGVDLIQAGINDLQSVVSRLLPRTTGRDAAGGVSTEAETETETG